MAGVAQPGGIRRDLRQVGTHRMRERDVRDDPATEERADPPLGPIEELIGHHDVQRPIFLFQAAHRARRQDPLDAQDLEAVDIRAEIQLGRQDAVPRAVTGQKCHAGAAERADHVWA
jgi:hypothetical protein